MVRLGHVVDRAVAGAGLAMEVAKHTESPIETMLAVAILRQWPDVEFRTNDAGPGRGWTLIPQFPFGRYRVDLALRKPDGTLIFIECDGSEFHSSPEQMERDAAREQLMVAAGFTVVRFTGAEINHSPAACANQLRRFRRWGS
jgi:REase_MTES_1575